MKIKKPLGIAAVVGFGLMLLAIAVCCGRTGAAISAKGVRHVSFEDQRGQTTKAQLKEGMQSLADGVSAAYGELRKTYPQLKGHFRGSLHTKPDGTVLNFTDIHSQFTPVLPPEAFSKLIRGIVGASPRFPAVGSGLYLAIDFQLEPNG
jgi:hypothetical protein